MNYKIKMIIIYPFLFPQQIAFAEVIISPSFHPVSQETINGVETIFDEQDKIDTKYINDLKGGLDLGEHTSLNVSFISEGSGYRNTFGLFTYKANGSIDQMYTLFENASGIGKGLAGGGNLKMGDSINISNFAPNAQIGFWVQANGYINHKAPIYYSDTKFNADQTSHIAMAYDAPSKSLIFGIEDLWKGGDMDYNDIVFSVNTENNSELYPIISTSSVKVSRPTQILKSATGRVTMTIPIFGKIQSLDHIVLHQKDLASLTNVLFEGEVEFLVESNAGILISSQVSSLRFGEFEIPVTYKLDGIADTIFTEPGKTHKATHVLVIKTMIEDLTNVASTTSSYVGTATITISAY